MKFPWDDWCDQANGPMLAHRYGDRQALGVEWAERKKIADKSEKRADGTANPHHPRFVMEEKIARLEFDMAFLVEANRILIEQNEIFGALFQRVGILEGAYSHLMTAAQSVKLEYYEKLKKYVNEGKKNKLETNQPKEP